MNVESFQPAVDTSGVMVPPTECSVNAGSQPFDLPAGGEDLEFTNEHATVICYVKFGKTKAGLTVTTSTGLPILPGQTKMYRRPDGHTAIAAIGSAAGPAILKIVPGRGI